MLLLLLVRSIGIYTYIYRYVNAPLLRARARTEWRCERRNHVTLEQVRTSLVLFYEANMKESELNVWKYVCILRALYAHASVLCALFFSFFHLSVRAYFEKVYTRAFLLFSSHL